jgi:hypothetical protein
LLIQARTQDASWLKVVTPDGNRAWISINLVETNILADLIPEAKEIPPTPVAPTATSTSPPPTASPTPPPVLVDTLLPEASALCQAAMAAYDIVTTVEAPILVLKKAVYESEAWRPARISELKNAGLMAEAATEVKSIICIEETREEKGTYTDGSKGYKIYWNVRFIGWPDGQLAATRNFVGADPPYRITRSVPRRDEYGEAPFQQLQDWVIQNLNAPPSK